ncbi:F-box protein At4g00755-like [Henckelia pumila]|uniref:F-box protein At4g00755-like n=1 Tax=Henckelia pumila TaxID=405737 RepID=UPI003C6E6D84
MESRINFVECLETDAVSSILNFLDDPSDIIRASSVSRSWQHFVIANSICKNLWLKKVPSFYCVDHVVEEKRGHNICMYVKPMNLINWEILKMEHNIYSSLLQALEKPLIARKGCVSYVVGASSTDTTVAQNIVNVLSPTDRYDWGHSYWSSKGQSDPNMPESILLKLNADICVVREIGIRPFEVSWEPGSPVYSAKSVRFHMGHPRSITQLGFGNWLQPFQFNADDYIWTYTSPEFTMTQESCIQVFEFPKPAVCMGGYLLIELVGRANRQETDGLFYIRLGYIRVLGEPMPPVFLLKMDTSGNLVLKHSPNTLESFLRNPFVDKVQTVHQPEDDTMNSPRLQSFLPRFLDNFDEDENE